MDPAKIALSADELALVRNGDWLLTKNAIIGKTYALFGELAEEIKQMSTDLPASFPAGLFVTPAKISRGENYKGLPYIILDYPRCFGRDNIFALRTMFWWGNFISVTLHLKGTYKEIFIPMLIKNIDRLASGDFYIGVHQDQWRHDFDTDNYVKIAEMGPVQAKQFLEGMDTCKLAARMSLEQWNEGRKKLPVYYRVLFGVLQS